LQKAIIILLSVLFALNVEAGKAFYQQPHKTGKFAIEGDAYFGKIIKHTSRFIPTVTQYTGAYELGVHFYSFGEKPWHRPWKYPEYGVTFVHAIYGNQNIFGSSYSLMPFIQFWIFRTKTVDMYFRAGFGAGILTKHYNPIDNPSNNVIGSTVNNITQFKLGLDWKLSPYVYLNTSGAFTHWSNAKFQNPNLGINLIAASIGIKVFPWVKERNFNTQKQPKPRKRNECILRFSVGINEMGRVPGGPKFAHYVGSIAYARYTSKVNKVYGGFCIGYDDALYHDLHYKEFGKGQNQHWLATNMSVFIGDEMLFGKVSLFAQLGYYVYYPIEKPDNFYAKLGANYYFASWGHERSHKSFIGVNLKNHKAVAAMLEFGGGVVF
jgi:Lipid A 3-O-deacylase (PagL)